jgi:PAS domain S-box-containing protein
MRLRVTARTFLRYGAAVATVGVALCLSLLITPLGERTPFILFFPAIMAAAWYGGLGPALVATVLSAVATDYVLLPPALGFSFTPTTALLLGVFVAVSVFISTVHTALRRERTRFAVTLTSIGDAVIATDPEGRVRFMNPVAEALTAWGAHEAKGKDLGEVLHIVNMETRDVVESPVGKVLREGTVVGLANHTLLLARDGTERPIDDSGSPIREPDGRLAGVVLVFRDVSERRRAEEALHESQARLHLALSASRTIAWSWDLRTGAVTHSENAGEILGLPASECISAGWERVHPEDVARVRATLERAVAQRGGYQCDFRVIRPDGGGVLWLQAHGTVECDAASEPLRIIGTATDITVRKRTEDGLRRAAALLELTHEAILVLDLNETILFWNRGATELYGWPPEEALGQVAYRLLGTRFPEPFQAIKAELLQRGRWAGDLAQTRRDGSPLVVSSRWALQRDAQGEPLAFLEINSDVTARTHMEAQIRASLAEKEVLLKEVHHRVKNNLQVISSLLSLQSASGQHPSVYDFVLESERRIQAMALVHETLYQGSDVARFPLATYVRTLNAHLMHAYSGEADRITVHTQVEAVDLPLETAVPCGLILSELLSNCLKHAFPNGEAGEVTVTLTREADRLRLTVRDSGCGFPEHLDFRQTESLGLQLVCALTDQLQGTIALERAGGTAVTVIFPLPSGQQSVETPA